MRAHPLPVSISAVLLGLCLSIPTTARAAGHARVVPPDSPAAVFSVVLTPKGATRPALHARVTVLVGGDVGRVSTRLATGATATLRFAVHRRANAYALFASRDATGRLALVGTIPEGGMIRLPGPGESTVTLTLVRVTTLAALRR